jgi:hypothetical protein
MPLSTKLLPLMGTLRPPMPLPYDWNALLGMSGDPPPVCSLRLESRHDEACRLRVGRCVHTDACLRRPREPGCAGKSTTEQYAQSSRVLPRRPFGS